MSVTGTRTVCLACAVVILLCANGALAQADPAAAARAHFQARRFKAGFKVLNEAHAKTRHEPQKYARVLLALAAFYQRHAGDFDEARRYLGEVLELGLPPANPSVKAAREVLGKLKKQAARYKKQNEALLRLSLEKYELQVARARVKELRAFITRNPDYPRLASAHYYLGKNLLLLDQQREAHRAFVKALKLRPALGFHLPVDHSHDTVSQRLLRQDLRLAARVALGLIGGVFLILFLLSRPWKTLGLRQGLILVTLLAGWWLFFRISVSIAGGTVDAQPGIFAKPIYLNTALGSPMSGILEILFWYGLVGVVGAFVMAVSTARFRRRWTWAAINAAAALLLVSSLMALFYLDHASQGAFRAAGEDRFSYIRGDFYYAKQSQGPFLLTDPMAYCKFHKTLHEMDEEQIKAWFRRYAKACQKRGRP